MALYDFAISTNPNNPNQDITYSIEEGTYRVIGTAQQLSDLLAMGVPRYAVPASLFPGLAQQTGWGPG